MTRNIFVGDRFIKSLNISQFVVDPFSQCIDTTAIRRAALDAVGTTTNYVSVYIPALDFWI
jgi:hypothetical protein